MGLKDKVADQLERALLSAAMSVLVFLLEQRLKKAFREREARPGAKSGVA